MAFSAHGTMSPYGAPVERSEILAASITTTVMDSLKVSSGFLALGTTGVLVFGHVTGITSNKDVGLNSTGVAGAEMGSYVGTFLTSSTNTTVAKVRAKCDISKQTLYSAELDAAAGITTGSNLLGYYIDLVDEDTLDESSALTTTNQYFSHGLDPADSARVIVNIAESLVFGV